MTVQRRGLTYLISISVRSRSPETAAELANAVAQAYIADQLASKINSTVASLAVIQSRTEQARTAIASSESAYDDFIAQNIDAIASDSGRQDLAQMQRQIAELESSRTRNAALVSTVQSAVASNDIDTIVANLRSDALGELERQREQLQRDLADPTNSPGSVNLREELARLEQQMLSTARTETQSLQNQLQDSQSQSATLRQDLRREVISSELSADTLSRIFELQQNAELARQQYQTLLSRTQDLEAQADLQLADSRVVSPALVPQTPSFPNKTLILALAGLVAIGMGVGLAFLYENLIGGFTSDDQLASVLKIPVAASIPRQQNKQDTTSYADLVTTNPLSIFTESVRRTRASIDQALRKVPQTGGGRVLMVTSSTPTRARRRCRWRWPAPMPSPGRACSDRLRPAQALAAPPPQYRHRDRPPRGAERRRWRDREDRAQHHPGRAEPALGDPRHAPQQHATDQLLDSPAFSRLLTAARNTFDVIVLDTPPVGPVVDGSTWPGRRTRSSSWSSGRAPPSARRGGTWRP